MKVMSHGLSDEANQWNQLATTSSLVDVVAHHVSALAAVHHDEAPEWLARLSIPPGWRLARFEGDGAQPCRIAVYGTQHDGGAYGCETLDIFRFTGIPPTDVVLHGVDCTLRDLHADNIVTQRLSTSSKPGAIGARSSGYFNSGGLRVWVQHSSYLAGSHVAGEGLLIQHGIFADSNSLPKLIDAITQLSDGVRHAFTAAVDTR